MIGWFRKLIRAIRFAMRKLETINKIIELSQKIRDDVEVVFLTFSTDPNVRRLKEEIVDMWYLINELRDP